MSEYINKKNILRYLKLWNGFKKEIIEGGDAYTVVLRGDRKSVVITTPYEVGEFFLEFLVDDKPFYSEWFEIMDTPLSEFMSYTEQVAKIFLHNEIRVYQNGWWIFKVDELQYHKSGSWHDVFDTEIWSK